MGESENVNRSFLLRISTKEKRWRGEEPVIVWSIVSQNGYAI
jgi:hypothetical protein